jgi:hypothetical protein
VCLSGSRPDCPPLASAHEKAPQDSHIVPASAVELIVLGVVGSHVGGVCDKLVVGSG